MKALILSGGLSHAHDFGVLSGAIAENLGRVGFSVEVEADVEAGIRRLAAEDMALVVVNMLRFTLSAGHLAHLREGNAFTLSAAGRSALFERVASGLGLLAVHTASVCFDDWSDWRTLVGASWCWERSSHAQPGPVEVSVRTDAHPITARLGDFRVVDEVYSDLDQAEGNVVLATASGAGRVQPVLWTRTVGGGRVVHDALGHGLASHREPTHAAILRRSALWAAGADDRVVEGA